MIGYDQITVQTDTVWITEYRYSQHKARDSVGGRWDLDYDQITGRAADGDYKSGRLTAEVDGGRQRKRGGAEMRD